MLPAPGTAIWLVLLGGWMTIDGTSVGQFMVSRPLVAATLAGCVVGDPQAGLAVGVVLELFHLGVLPVGAARYPEGGPAAVVAGALFASSSGQVPGALLMVTAFALIWERIAGESTRAMRHMNVRVVGGPEGTERIDRLQLRHLAAIAFDFVRGMVLVGAGLLCLSLLLLVSARNWGLDPQIARFAVHASIIGLLAATFGIFHRRKVVFLTGMALGLLFVLLRG